MSWIPVIVLAIVFILIAVRQVGNVRLQIWQIMLGGAIAVLLAGQIGPVAALHAIDLDVMLFLLGMFIIGQAMEESGYLSHLSYRIFRHAKSMDALVLLVLFVMGLGSALLMNDTLAIVGAPVMLLLARQHRISPKLLLLTLAFGITIGSVMSPIGNPQNLLIALHGQLENPFLTFLRYLLLPTLISLIVAHLLLRLFYRKEFHSKALTHVREPIADPRLALLCRISLLLIACLVLAKIILVVAGAPLDLRLTYIALAGALPVLCSPRRGHILKRMDWRTLVFFAAMFVLMESVWLTGVFQSLIAGMEIATIPFILGVSVIASQFISNVPLVALFLPLLVQAGAGARELAALAAGSTIAGNLLILGAASNVIIINAAEERGETITFLEFAKVGVPLTAANVLVYWLFL